VLPQADRKVEVWWSKSREEPGAHKQRHPVNQDQIQHFGENRVDTIFGAGLNALLFFCQHRLYKIIANGNDAIGKSHRAQF
jgi:hypothetical protein